MLQNEGLAVAEIDNNSTFHLQVMQAKQDDDMILLITCPSSILKHNATLTKLSKYVLINVCFSNDPFFIAICNDKFKNYIKIENRCSFSI